MAYGNGPKIAEQAAGATTLADFPFASSGVLPLTIPDGASGNVDFGGLSVSLRVVDFWVVTTDDPGANANSMQLQTSAGVAVTNAVSINGVGDTAIVRAQQIDDAVHVFAGTPAVPVTMRVARVRVAGTAAVIAYVRYIRV